MRVRAKGKGKGRGREETNAPDPLPLEIRTENHPPWPPRPTHRIPLQFSALRQPGTKGRIDWVFERDAGCEVKTDDDPRSARQPDLMGGGWEKKIRLEFEVPQDDEDRNGMGMGMGMEEEEEEDPLIQFSITTWDIPPLLPSPFPGMTNARLTRLLGTILASAISTTHDPERTTFMCHPKGKCGEVMKMYENETRIRPRIGVFWTGTEGPLGGRRGLVGNEDDHDDAEDEAGTGQGQGDRDRVYLASIDGTGGWTRLANEEGEDHSSLIDRMYLSHYPNDSVTRDTFARALKVVLYSPHRLTGIRLEVPARTGRVDRFLRGESHLNSARQQHEDLIFALGMDLGRDGQKDATQCDLAHKGVVSCAGSVDLREPRLLGNVITVCSGYVLFLAERSGGADKDPTDETLPWEVGLLVPDSSVVVPFNQKVGSARVSLGCDIDPAPDWQIVLYHLTDSFILDSRWNHSTMANLWYNCLHGFDERLKDQEWSREIVRSLELVSPRPCSSQRRLVDHIIDTARQMIQTWHKDKTESTRWVREGIRYYSKRCPRQIKRDVEGLLEGFERKVAQVDQGGG
jgi:hypothetical protein